METVSIIAPFDYGDLLRARLEGCAGLSVTASGLVVEDGQSRVYVRRNEHAEQEMEPWELARIRARVPAAVYYGVDFSDIQLCRKVLVCLSDDPLLWVDNDHGVFCSGPDFVRLLRERPDWDWRRDKP